MFQSGEEHFVKGGHMNRVIGFRRMDRFATGDNRFWRRGNKYTHDNAGLVRGAAYDKQLDRYIQTRPGSAEARVALDSLQLMPRV